ncbi:MAG TPA: Ig-like domain-containing protein, partial [Kofleriaceae bacterium]|nr:Ig-like domain-containing protein [Kofleriaceae bacterium]
MFTFPIEGQNDVPVGSRIVVTFSEKVTAGALGPCTASTGAFCVVGPSGPVDAMPVVSEDGTSVSLQGDLAPGTTYDVFARSELAPFAENLPSGKLFSFTTRSDRPRAAAPTLVSINGGDPAKVGASFRPMFETTTLRLLFSEPLDPRSIKMGAGTFELLDTSGSAVPATIVSDGIHVSIDPKADLTADANYTLRLGNQIVDLGGQPLAPFNATIKPAKSRSATPVLHVLKPAQQGDPGFGVSRSGAKVNEIVIDKPLIGRETSQFTPVSLVGEIGDPKALGGPIAFTLRKGQRLATTPLDIKLGGQIPSGLKTGDVMIELLTDATGRLYRNPYQPAEQRPENANAPLYVDLSMDVAIFAKDPKGNAVMTQTVLGMQATGTAIGTDGALVIETVSSMELGLLGVTKAPSNLVLSLFTEGPGPMPAADTEAPTLVTSNPGQSDEANVDAGIELTFSEPIDLDRARAGGIKLQDTAGGADVAAVIESHGAGVVVRPLTPLPYGKIYRVVLGDIADVAGNKANIPNVSFTTPVLQSTGVPGSVVAIHPGVPCALTGGTASSPGRCAGGDDTDDLYKPFTIGPNEPVEVVYSEPVRRTSVTRGMACNQGTFRVEETDAAGTCTAVVAGTLIARERTMTFIPDAPWVMGKRYKLTLVSGTND